MRVFCYWPFQNFSHIAENNFLIHIVSVFIFWYSMKICTLTAINKWGTVIHIQHWYHYTNGCFLLPPPPCPSTKIRGLFHIKPSPLDHELLIMDSNIFSSNGSDKLRERRNSHDLSVILYDGHIFACYIFHFSLSLSLWCCMHHITLDTIPPPCNNTKSSWECDEVICEVHLQFSIFFHLFLSVSVYSTWKHEIDMEFINGDNNRWLH